MSSSFTNNSIQLYISKNFYEIFHDTIEQLYGILELFWFIILNKINTFHLVEVIENK